MLVLRVVGSENASNAPLPSAQFDARGGTIGREASNRLVLPDPERFISRVQAEVVQRLGEYVLVNRGMGPITINGRPLQHGDESVLRVRDQLRIGGYRIEVDWVTGTADSVPIDEALAVPTRGNPAVCDERPAVPSPTLTGSAGLPGDWDPFATGTWTSGPSTGESLDELFGGPAPKPGQDRFQYSRTAPHDDVGLGAAAPRAVAVGREFVAHFAAYPSESEAVVASLLGKQSPDAIPVLGKRTCRWAPGTEVRVVLSGEGFSIRQPRQSFTWNSRVETLDFAVRASKELQDRTRVLEFDVFIADCLIAVVCLNIDVAMSAVPGQQFVPSRAARSAFASYASADRSLVAQLVGAIQRSAGISVFLDCLDLQANEIWKGKLAAEIRQRDLFLLFWSRQARASPWVEWEWRTAVREKGAQAVQLHPLEPDLPPPAPLLHLHAGSLHALVAATTPARGTAVRGDG